jgi:hypothetical protein
VLHARPASVTGTNLPLTLSTSRVRLSAMLKKYQVLLLVPLALLGPALLYRLDPPLGPPVQPANASSGNDHSNSLDTFSEADFSRHVEQLKKKLPSSNFTVIVQRPFVVIGDESPADVKEHSEQTVRISLRRTRKTSSTSGCSKMALPMKRTRWRCLAKSRPRRTAITPAGTKRW